ncbi:unnamed protein product [Dibothriocephalus latus]|uniref:RNA polymerase II-associated factor 1 homolog n=1 Tax=Dibothriocephalus latus TaxID=60516 RepID=A0A3P7NNB7_DIBLA|nr:unnamed protein product [Dibothriocephalus latus]
MVDKTGDHFVAYFLPTDETRQLRRQDAQNQTTFTEGASYEYELAREYNWNVKNKTMANYEENYFFVFRNDGTSFFSYQTTSPGASNACHCPINPNSGFLSYLYVRAVSAPIKIYGKAVLCGRLT